MKIYTTKQMIEEFDESKTRDKIHRFKCNPEKSIERDLRNRIVKSDQDRNSITHYILNDSNGHKIMVFFTLKFDRIEKSYWVRTIFALTDAGSNQFIILFIFARDEMHQEHLKEINLFMQLLKK